MHLIIDAIATRPLSVKVVRYFLRECPTELGMHIVSGPNVVARGTTIDGIVIIAESHISVHVIKNQVALDIFSCKEFNLDKLREYAMAKLSLREYNVRFIKRLILPSPEGFYNVE